MKFGTGVCLKHLNDRGDIELDRTRGNNNIAENSVAQVHDKQNRHTSAVAKQRQTEAAASVKFSPIK